MMKKFLLSAMVVILALLTVGNIEPTLAADNLQSAGSIEIENRTNIWGKEGMTISRVEYLSYSTEDLNNANWKMMCNTLHIGDTCINKGLSPGKYIVRTLWGGETIEVFTDISVSAGYTTRLSAEKIYIQDTIIVINDSSYKVEHIMAQEGNYISDPVSLAEKPLLMDRIAPGAWQSFYVNGDFPAHHILVRDEVTARWFYNVPTGGVIIWTGGNGRVLDKSIYIDFLGNPPGAMYVELYQGDFREISWEPLSNGVYRGTLPNEVDYSFWNVLIVDTYCGGLSYGAAFCSVPLTSNSPSTPFVIDGCNFDYACNGKPSGDLP